LKTHFVLENTEICLAEQFAIMSQAYHDILHNGQEQQYHESFL